MIIFLQNAWSPVYAGQQWPRRSWLRALARSRSGQRLKILSDQWELYHNVTPICGAKPSSKLDPDQLHVQSLLERCKPEVVVACGAVAELALRIYWKGPLLCVPHPASRVLTNELYQHAHRMLDAGFAERYALRQLRGALELKVLS